MKRKFQKFLKDNGYAPVGYGYKKIIVDKDDEDDETVHWVTLFDEDKNNQTLKVQFYSYIGNDGDLGYNYTTGIINVNITEFSLLVNIFGNK